MRQFSRFSLALIVLIIGNFTQSSQTVSASTSNNLLRDISGKIAFLSRRDHVCNSDGMCNETIYTTNPDGSNQQRLIDSRFWAVTASVSSYSWSHCTFHHCCKH